MQLLMNKNLTMVLQQYGYFCGAMKSFKPFFKILFASQTLFWSVKPATVLIQHIWITTIFLLLSLIFTNLARHNIQRPSSVRTTVL